MASALRKTQHLFILELLLPHVWTLLICFRPSCHSKGPQLLRTKRFYTTKKEQKPCSDQARTHRTVAIFVFRIITRPRTPTETSPAAFDLFYSKMAVNVCLRMFFYGLHGFFDEILFTSMLNFAESNFIDWSCRGHSSLWSFFMYGFGSFIIEQFYLLWKDKPFLSMPVRGFLYVIWVYIWEFSCGMLLRYFNACPWDYSSRQWNLSGLITLQCFPAWYGRGETHLGIFGVGMCHPGLQIGTPF